MRHQDILGLIQIRSQVEVAAILGITRQAVSDTEQRAFRKLRPLLWRYAVAAGVIKEYKHNQHNTQPK